MNEKRDQRGMTEAESIAYYQSLHFPKPALTADIVVLSRQEDQHRVLLIQRKNHPFIGQFALPGGFADENEPVEQTAARELEEETAVHGLPMKLVGIFSRPGRDPRGWIVSAAYVSVVNAEDLQICAGDDAATAGWYPLKFCGNQLLLCLNGQWQDSSVLAFDHAEILKQALSAANIEKL